MHYLYAITDLCVQSQTLPPGIAGVPPEILPFDKFSAVAARLPRAPAGDVATARLHMSVLDALMAEEAGAVLPARFGTTFSGHEDLKQALNSRQDALLADLRRLRGQIELGVSVADRREQNSQAESKAQAVPFIKEATEGPGAHYIARKYAENELRLQRGQVVEQLAAKICAEDSPLVALAGATSWRAQTQSDASAISAAFLLPRERLAAFLAALDDMRLAEPELDFLCTGPWPPFSFVSVGVSPSSGKSAHVDTAHNVLA
ncbi:MAG: GvpL/GvpF family gas vesicle protein [Alphaproteobacteria bacterium]